MHAAVAARHHQEKLGGVSIEAPDEEVDVAKVGVGAQAGPGRLLAPPGPDQRIRETGTGSTEDPAGVFARLSFRLPSRHGQLIANRLPVTLEPPKGVRGG